MLCLTLVAACMFQMPTFHMLRVNSGIGKPKAGVFVCIAPLTSVFRMTLAGVDSDLVKSSASVVYSLMRPSELAKRGSMNDQRCYTWSYSENLTFLNACTLIDIR